MADRTAIEWADASVNPLRARGGNANRIGWFCERVSPGCVNCYSEAMNRRLGTGVAYQRQNRDRVEIMLDENLLMQPLSWRKPRRIFWNSMSDTFAEFVPDEWIDRMFAVMALTPQHTHLVLTKRAQRMREYFTDQRTPNAIARFIALRGGEARPPVSISIPWPLNAIWLGVSVEDQQRADERIPELLATPAAKRFISAEPLLGPIDLWGARYRYPAGHVSGAISNWGQPPRIDWVICGGESGPGARPSHPDWFRSLRDQCAAAGVAYFHKQNGEWASVSEVAGPGEHYTFPDGATVRRVGKSRAGRLLDGREHSEFPA